MLEQHDGGRVEVEQNLFIIVLSKRTIIYWKTMTLHPTGPPSLTDPFQRPLVWFPAISTRFSSVKTVFQIEACQLISIPFLSLSVSIFCKTIVIVISFCLQWRSATQVERIPELPHEQSQTVEIANVQVGKFKYKYTNANANTQILTCNHMQVDKSAKKSLLL